MSPAKTAELQVISLLCRLVWAPVLDGVHIITEYHVSLTTVAAMRPGACITIATYFCWSSSHSQCLAGG